MRRQRAGGEERRVVKVMIKQLRNDSVIIQQFM